MSQSVESETYSAVAQEFAGTAKIKEIRRLGSGNINDTFLVEIEGRPSHFVLQKINTQVFLDPQGMMDNILQISDWINAQIPQLNYFWETPTVLLTQAQSPLWRSETGEAWRALSYLENTTAYDQLTTPQQAQAVGAALGRFHGLLSALDPRRLTDTLPGFHITPQYLAQYLQVLAENPPLAPAEEDKIRWCQAMIGARQQDCFLLEEAKEKGVLPLRIIHGDPKVNNILFRGEQAIALIDLDTVKPGLIHYDLGDCLRSACNPLGEETQNWEEVSFDLDLCQGVLEGYLGQGKDFLTPPEYDYLYPALRVITLELGLRFFSDYLRGNCYFKCHHPAQNLHRALTQFHLLQSIETQAGAIQTLIRELQ
ncbi:MAG: phosphotransferase enzyme family protein [Cyanobacteriota bacterium]|jgi:Ser/Thr protein kinase RdoA (MazF antagonist)